MYQCKHVKQTLISAWPQLPSFNVMLNSRNLLVLSTHRNYFLFCGSAQLIFWLLFWFEATAATQPKDSKLTTACSDCTSLVSAVLFIAAELSGILVWVFVDCDMDGVKRCQAVMINRERQISIKNNILYRCGRGLRDILRAVLLMSPNSFNCITVHWCISWLINLFNSHCK